MTTTRAIGTIVALTAITWTVSHAAIGPATARGVGRARRAGPAASSGGSTATPAAAAAASSAADDARILRAAIPSFITTGEKARATVRVRNTGTTTWTRATHQLKAIGGSGGDAATLLGGRRVNLPAGARVTPGRAITFRFDLTAPSSPGSFRPTFKMTARGGAAFGERVRAAVATSDDELDPSLVTWLHADVSAWPTTSRITRLRIEPGQICIDHTLRGQLPALGAPPIVGNPWVIANVNGRWFAGTYEWLRPGQECKALGSNPPATTVADLIGPHIKRAPLETWRPRKGERVGFLVSTFARDGRRTSDERTNIVMTTWPFD